MKKASKAKKASKGVKFSGDFRTIPSARMLLAVCIKALESGKAIPIPTTPEEARAVLGYVQAEEKPAKAA